MLPDATLIASEQRAVPGEGARLVTTLTRHPGGASVQVHARIDESFTLVYDAIVTRGERAAAALPTAVGAGVASRRRPVPAGRGRAEPRRRRRDPAADNLTAGAESRRELREVVAGLRRDHRATGWARSSAAPMGYEPEDLPWEVPLIELGLDSLMAVRIKNRVEYDFDLPPIQLTAVRDANLYAVEKLIEYAIEHRDEVDELAEQQKGKTAEEIAAEQAELMGGATTVAELEAKLAEAGHPIAADAEPADEVATAATDRPVPLDIPPPPTDPSRPCGRRPILRQAPARPRPPRYSPRRPSPRRWAPTCRRATPPSGSRSRPGRSSPASRRAASSTSCRRSTTTPAAKIAAAALRARAEGTITADDVAGATHHRGAGHHGARATSRPASSTGSCGPCAPGRRAPTRVPVFVFHPAGGSTVVYEPLLKRLPADTPMYGIERVEGSIEERAREYVPKLMEIQGDRARSSWPAGRWAACWPTPARSGSSRRAPTCGSSG